VNFNTFTFIYEGFRVLSAAFVWILLLATTCHISTFNSWHVFTVFPTYIPLRYINPLAYLLFYNRQLRVICDVTHANSFHELSVKFDTF